MKHFSIINRGYSYYRTHTRKERDCLNLRNEIKQSNVKLDNLCSTKLNIKIEEDWIIEIEEGIRHIAEAVGQERQFIATTGEVIPIEKVKRVSKASIVHLAKHSDLISRLPEEGEILIPDKVYMEEKISDFTVYENRFLYTLLVYLQQFVNMRLEKINETIRTYRGSLSLNKEVVSKNYNFTLELTFKEERFDILNNLVDKETNDLIDRLEMIAREIISLLACPLMKDVSKAPLVKPPLVKTNVLKNNKNFKAAVLLYDYINACTKDGYAIEEINDEFSPFNNEISDDYAELLHLTSFMTYKHGTRQSDVLKKEFENYEEDLKKKEQEELNEKISKLKNRLIERDISIEEYVLLLEKRNTELEEENSTIELYKQEIEDLKQEVFDSKTLIDEKENYITNLQEDKENLNNELTVLTQNFDELSISKDELERSLKEEIDNLRETILEELKDVFEEDKLKIIEEYKEKEQEKTNAFEEIERDIRENLDAKQLEFSEKIDEMNEVVDNAKDELEKALEETKKANNDKAFAYAQLLAMRLKHNMTTQEDDYTSRERFEELEAQYFAFEQFFSEEWKRTKKKLRKKYLGK